jgi:hypothetical protein
LIERLNSSAADAANTSGSTIVAKRHPLCASWMITPASNAESPKSAPKTPIKRTRGRAVRGDVVAIAPLVAAGGSGETKRHARGQALRRKSAWSDAGFAPLDSPEPWVVTAVVEPMGLVDFPGDAGGITTESPAKSLSCTALLPPSCCEGAAIGLAAAPLLAKLIY